MPSDFHKSDNGVTLVEAWAHVGKAKAAQRNKVLSDMLKLALVTSVLRKSYPGLRVHYGSPVKHVLAFARKSVDMVLITAVPRLCAELLGGKLNLLGNRETWEIPESSFSRRRSRLDLRIHSLVN